MIAGSRVVIVRRIARTATSNLRVRGMASSASSATPATGYFVLQYDYVSDILEKRDPFRAGHLGAAKKMAEDGKMIVAGAYTDPVDGATFCFKGVSREEVQAYVDADPYTQAGLIKDYRIRGWNVVAGSILDK